MNNKKLLSVLAMVILAITLIGCNKKTKPSNLLPNLDGLNEVQIQEKFQSQGLIVSIDYKEYFVKDSTERIFAKYGEGFKEGNEASNGDVITIFVNSPSISLPDLKGLNRDEMAAELENIGVTSKEVSYELAIDNKVKPGTFIGYKGKNIGERFDFATKLVIRYDISKVIPDITGMNKYQIIEVFEDLSLANKVKFNYILDNSKEFDLFASYKSFKVGDSVSTLDDIEINIYSNDNVNIGDVIANPVDLFISKYIDGIGNDQAIELFNSTSKDIDLTGYYIAILENGSLTATNSIQLEGIIKPNETFVLVKEGASSNLLAKADQTSNALIFDGNDTIQLRKTSNNTFIDTIYSVGNILSTMDAEIFIRKSEVVTGNRLFVQTEWLGYIPEFIDPVGIHPWAETFEPEFDLIADKTFQEYGMTKAKFLSLNDGDTVSVESIDPRDNTNYKGDNRLRFLIVDTPETAKPGVVGQPYAQVATQFTKRLLEAASEIYIQSDPAVGLVDTYKRTLALVWYKIDTPVVFTNIAASDSITIEPGYHLLNLQLIQYGLGEKGISKTIKYKESPIYSNRYLYQWANEAEFYALTNKLGVYSGVNRA